LAAIIENTNSVDEYMKLIQHSRRKTRLLRLLGYLILKAGSKMVPTGAFQKLMSKAHSLKVDQRGEYKS
jgi:hypothetical protein